MSLTRYLDRKSKPSKPLGILGAAASLALMLASPAVEAQPAKRGGGPRAHPPRRCMPKHVLAKIPQFDSNGNGKLEPSEHQAMREAERKADLATFDLDGDGRLSKKEHVNLRHSKMVRDFELLDTDHNAEISHAEAAGSCSPIERGFARIDVDGSGSITWSEFEKAAPKGPPRHGPGHGPPRHGPPQR
ncbi:MAG: hypothetical protein GY811_21910 [Myxococcales bacterium]|nr:hypothetical protein [Myxococcales bacterium]